MLFKTICRQSKPASRLLLCCISLHFSLPLSCFLDLCRAELLKSLSPMSVPKSYRMSTERCSDLLLMNFFRDGMSTCMLLSGMFNQKLQIEVLSPLRQHL